MANYYYVKNSIKPIPIGFEGENDARTVVFDIHKWIEDYGNGSALLVHQRPGDAEPYPCATEQKAGTIEWAVQQADIIAGAPGRAQLSYQVGDNIVARSPIYKTVACASISAAEAGEPGQDWINDVLDAAAQAETSATNAAASAETAKQAETAATQAATSAAADANAAAQSEASANKSASAAAGSATAASNSATAAAGSAETAQTAATTATDAAGQAQAAQTAAESAKTEAASSAAAAAGSATSAQTHATTAQQAAETATSAAENAANAVSEQLKEDVQGIVDNLDGLSEAIAIRETATGEVISVSDSADYRLLGLKLYGKSVQDGVPTPEAPVEIESAGDGGDIGVKIQGKNLIYTTSVSSSNGVTMSKNDDGTFTLNGTVTGSNAGLYFWGKYDQPKQLLPNGSYKYKVDGLFDNDNYTIRSIDNGNQAQGSNGDILTYSYSIYQVAIILRLGNTYDNVIIKPMLVYGDDMPDEFVPGIDPQTLTYPTPNGLPGIPVESGGNYTDAEGQQWICDEVDFARGKYVQRINHITLTSNMGWYPNSRWDQQAPDIFHFYINITDKKVDTQNGANNILCTHFECKTVGRISLINTECIYGLYENQAIYVFLAKSRANTPDLDGFNGWIDQNQPVVYYILQNGVETDLTPEQITAYLALKTYKPNTTITTDSDPSAGVEVNYVADTKTYIDNKLAAISEAILGGTKNGNV